MCMTTATELDSAAAGLLRRVGRCGLRSETVVAESRIAKAQPETSRPQASTLKSVSKTVIPCLSRRQFRELVTPVNHDRPKIVQQIRLEAARGSNNSQVSIQAQPV